MGGRGGASGFPSGAPGGPIGPQSAADAKYLNELAQYMANVGRTVDTASLAGYNFDGVKQAAASVEYIMQEFPQAQLVFDKLQGETLRKGAMACARLSGKISLAEHYYAQMSDQGLAQRYDQAVKNGFHPAGTTSNQIAAHEAGHVLEAALIRRNIPGSDYWDRVDRAKAWDKSTFSTKVVSEACRAVKKTADGKGRSNDQLVKSVSGYATKNRSEALAECVADYAANGAKANPLSVAVWSILKRELG